VVVAVASALFGLLGSTAQPTWASTTTSGTSTTTTHPMSYWKSQFDSGDAKYVSQNLPLSKSGDSWDHYNLAYAIDAETSMYQATGQSQYLDHALAYVQNMIATAKPSSTFAGSQFRDGYRGWVSQRSDVRGQEVPLFESYAWRYATQLLVDMRSNPTTYNNASYRAQYNSILAFAQTNIFDKWFHRGANAYLYRNRTHMAAHWAYIASNLSRLETSSTRLAQEKTVVSNIDLHLPNASSSLKAQMKPSPVNPNAYFWSDVWGSTSRPGQDVAHGNGVISYVVAAHDAGNPDWTASDMAKFSATLTTAVTPAGRAPAAYVDGSGSGTGWVSDGFVKLGRYSSAVQKHLESANLTYQVIANMALNASILAAHPAP
jgi:hypothetical protein